jgi:dephospho-CoA kinase
MSVIILTGKSCSGKDGVRREMEKSGFNNIVSGKKWI